MPDAAENCEVFYDSMECLADSEEDPGSGFWRNELKSVKERRHDFLCKMGFSDEDHQEKRDLDRISESNSGNLSTSEFKFTNETVDNSDRCDDDQEANAPEIEAIITPEPSHEEEEEDLRRKKGGGTHQWWWRKISTLLSRAKKGGCKAQGVSRTKVRVNKKRFKELSGLYAAQEFRAHEGGVWAAQFSPDGQFLATGGRDGVVRVWGVVSAGSSDMSFGEGHMVVVPDQVFGIRENPVHELAGHCGDVLDISWSNSNMILSSSADNTVRLWQVGSDECLGVFRHTDFVTCVQFDPVNKDRFVSGSIDGKIRVWSVSEGRVVDWDNVRNAVTAISYQPDAQGLVAGFMNGICRFYESSDSSTLNLTTQVQIARIKRSSGSRIVGIQFCKEDPQRVMITSEDSKIRVFDKTDIVRKYKGIAKSGAQMSASFTPSGKHILSVGEDSRVYLWNYDGQSPTSAKSTHSCEYFHSQGATVALTWHGIEPAAQAAASCADQCCAQSQGYLDPDRISLAKWFTEGSARVTATWPEEILPSDEPSRRCGCDGPQSPTWGLVIVTASCDGMIRVHHNYGLLPVAV